MRVLIEKYVRIIIGISKTRHRSELLLNQRSEHTALSIYQVLLQRVSSRLDALQKGSTLLNTTHTNKNGNHGPQVRQLKLTFAFKRYMEIGHMMTYCIHCRVFCKFEI